MKIAFFDTHLFEQKIFNEKNKQYDFPIKYLEMKLNTETAVFAQGCEVVCAFVNDKVNAECLAALKAGGVQLVALR
ncbi:hypothetical protein HMI54_013924, partial [Coelomomyces lativittatus]